MKCFEVVKCSQKERDACSVWNTFRKNPEDLEGIKCWILKNRFEPGSRNVVKECLSCKYYMMVNQHAQLVTDYDSDVAMISCDGVVNTERTRALLEVWEKLKAGGRKKVLLNLSRTNSIYSCGLGAIVRIHKETVEKGGVLVVLAPQGYVRLTLETTKLSRVIHMAIDEAEARTFFDAVRAKEAEAAAAKAQAAALAKEAAAPPPPPKPRKRIPCWEYWKDHNPRNAMGCNECFKKMDLTGEPCWIVDGEIEGITFQYVEESCEGCAYYTEFKDAEA